MVFDITAQVALPNGDRVAYSVGGVLVQSAYAGTYVGTFSANVDYNEFPIGCAGSAVLVIDPYGEVLTGASDCRVSFNGYELDLQFLFDVDHDGDGTLSGTVAADIFGWFQFDLDAEGSISKDDEPLMSALQAVHLVICPGLAVTADRISLDAGL